MNTSNNGFFDSSVRVGSLFSGYGGLDIAVGGTLQWWSDIEKSSIAVMSKHHSGKQNIGDVKIAEWEKLDSVDVITGGYPCQPFSHAGNRKGSLDDRHLWPYVFCAITVIRPNFVILENVRGHVSLGLDSVISDMNYIGYTAKWTIVKASDIGAPHQRQRVFILARKQNQKIDTSIVNKNRKTILTNRIARPTNLLPTPTVVDMGNNKTPKQWDEWKNKQREKHKNGNGHGASLTQEAIAISRSIKENQGSEKYGKYNDAIVQWEKLTRTSPFPTIEPECTQINTRFVEWMMGLDDGYVTSLGLSRSQELKLLGNGVCPQQAMFAIDSLFES
jgi:DNA (cytosine-5)-methyltransferase 1